MKVISRYIERNRQKIKQIFQSNSKDQELPATKIFTFFQLIFEIQSLSFAKDGKEFFKDENNGGFLEKVIQQFYKTTQDGRTSKFYLYRVNFEYTEVLQFLQYWLNTDKSLTVKDPIEVPRTPPSQFLKEKYETANEQKKIEQISLPPELRQSALLDNQFIVEEEKKPILIAAYQGEITKMEEMLLRAPQNMEESVQIQQKINMLKKKITLLSAKQESVSPKTDRKSLPKQYSLSTKNSKTQTKDKRLNLKVVFEYYAKQNHLTGAKSSFEHIEHSTQTINYQKLVYFLKECELFPEKAKDQKKVYNLYVRACSNTRDLFYSDFLTLLQKLPQIVVNAPERSPQQKKDLMMAKIQINSEKNKLLHNPFHSPQKQNFRIDKNDLKYEFKLKPVNGKLEAQVNIELANRKKQKEEMKMQQEREKRQKQIQKLKKLMAIDPYHPMVVKNNHLLRQKSYSVMEQPVVNLDNMEKIRDASFDIKAKFGIADLDEDPLKAMMSNRYGVDKRVEMMQRQQSLKMSNLMSRIIQSSQEKLAKLGLSPRQRPRKLFP